MANYGNMPYPLARQQARSTRRRRIRRAVVAGAHVGLFATSPGKKLLGKGLKKIGSVSPRTRRMLTHDIRLGYRGARKVGRAGKKLGFSLLGKSMARFPSQTSKALGYASKASTFWTGAKALLRAL